MKENPQPVEQVTKATKFDYATYDPFTSFVTPLGNALRAEDTQPVDPIINVRQHIATLPTEALAPAIDTAINAFDPTTSDEPDPSETAVHDYLIRCTTTPPDDLENDEERKLRTDYRESTKLYKYYGNSPK